MRLVLGGPSKHLEIAAIGIDGQPLSTIAGTATVRNSRIARLEGLEVFPVSVGATTVDIDVGDCSDEIPIEIDSLVRTPAALGPFRVFAERVELVPGEVRSWHLAPGPYELWLAPDSLVDTARELVTHNTNCVQVPGEGKRYLCVALQNAAVALRDTTRPRNGKALTGELSMRMDLVQPDDPTDEAAAATAARRDAHACKEMEVPRYSYVLLAR